MCIHFLHIHIYLLLMNYILMLIVFIFRYLCVTFIGTENNRFHFMLGGLSFKATVIKYSLI